MYRLGLRLSARSRRRICSPERKRSQPPDGNLRVVRLSLPLRGRRRFCRWPGDPPAPQLHPPSRQASSSCSTKSCLGAAQRRLRDSPAAPRGSTRGVPMSTQKIGPANERKSTRRAGDGGRCSRVGAVTPSTRRLRLRLTMTARTSTWTTCAAGQAAGVSSLRRSSSSSSVARPARRRSRRRRLRCPSRSRGRARGRGRG